MPPKETTTLRRIIQIVIAQIVVAVSLGVAACGGSNTTAPPEPPGQPNPQAVASVEVTPSSAGMTIGQTVQLTAVPKASDGSVLNGRAVTWTTSDEAVASVNGGGQVTGVAAGNISITATSEQVSGSATVSVTAPGPPGFTIRSPDVELFAGQEITTCYYFRTPNMAQLAIRRWQSRMMVGGLDMTLFLTDGDRRPPGTQSDVGCSYQTASEAPPLTYIAYRPEAAFDFPADDGAGTPVGQLLPANQAGFLRLHYRNPTGATIAIHVELEAIAYEANTVVTRAEPYITYNANIDVPPMSSATAIDTCATPEGARFFSISTYSHKHSVHTYIKDAAATVFESTNFSDPGSVKWTEAPFFTFASGSLTYQCDYVNATPQRIFSGDNTEVEEQCVAVTYFFPATAPVFCYNGFVVPSNVERAVLPPAPGRR